MYGLITQNIDPDELPILYQNMDPDDLPIVAMKGGKVDGDTTFGRSWIKDGVPTHAVSVSSETSRLRVNFQKFTCLRPRK